MHISDLNACLLNDISLYMYITICIHSPADGYLGCFWLGATVNKAAINTPTHGFEWTYAFSSLGETPMGRIPSYIKRVYLKELPHCFPK